MYSGNVSALWHEFSVAHLEAVIPPDAHLILYPDGHCAILWSGSGMRNCFETFGQAHDWLIEQADCAWGLARARKELT